MGQEQLDGVVVADPPETGLAQVGADEVAVVVDDPGTGLPVEEVLAVVTDDDLLGEVIVVAGEQVVALALAAPHTDHRQQAQQTRMQVGALAEVGGVGGQRQIVPRGDVAFAAARFERP